MVQTKRWSCLHRTKKPARVQLYLKFPSMTVHSSWGERWESSSPDNSVLWAASHWFDHNINFQVPTLFLSTRDQGHASCVVAIVFPRDYELPGGKGYHLYLAVFWVWTSRTANRHMFWKKPERYLIRFPENLKLKEKPLVTVLSGEQELGSRTHVWVLALRNLVMTGFSNKENRDAQGIFAEWTRAHSCTKKDRKMNETVNE